MFALVLVGCKKYDLAIKVRNSNKKWDNRQNSNIYSTYGRSRSFKNCR